jgi:hypothetical protein
LLQDRVDRLRIERPLRNRAPAPDLAKHAALVDVCRSRPRVECLDWPAGEIDDIVRLATRRFGAAEMDGDGGEGRAVGHLDRSFHGQLFQAKACDLAASAAAGGKGDHQDGAIRNVAQAIGRASGDELRQDIAGHRFGALSLPGPRDRAHGEANG